jgi:hypothetical protein
MDKKVKELLNQEAGEEMEPRFCLRSQTQVDTGGWLGGAPLWLAVSEKELFVLASGKRPYFERVSLEDCAETRYNPANGEIIIAPTKGLICNQLAFSPSEAIEILKILEIEESHWGEIKPKVVNLPSIPASPPLIEDPGMNPSPASAPKTSKFAKYKAQQNQ